MRQLRAARRVRISAWLRAFAAFAALLIAGDHALLSLHQVLTRHEVCAEHGELIHEESTGERFALRGSVAAFENGARAEEEHHHCGAVPASPTRAPAVAEPSTCVAPELVVVSSVQAFESELPAPDVLAFAPKLSPPG